MVRLIWALAQPFLTPGIRGLGCHPQPKASPGVPPWLPIPVWGQEELGHTWECAKAEEIRGILRGQVLGEEGRGFRGPFAAGVAPHRGLGEKTEKTP